MFGMDELIQVIVSLCGTLGFGILFNHRGKKLLFGALGGMLAWVIFLLLGLVIEDEVIRYFIVSTLVSVYAEILARIIKTPTTTFCIVSLVPLIPGSGLYYSMAYALEGSIESFLARAAYTLELTAALSMGIVLVTAIMRGFKTIVHNRRARRA